MMSICLCFITVTELDITVIITCPYRVEALSDDARLAYIGPKSRTERSRKTKIGTEIAHITRDSNTTFKDKRSKVNLQGVGVYCGSLQHSLFYDKL